MFHVKGHSGHPWNDLADAVCGHFFRHRPAVYGNPLPTNSKQLFALELVGSIADDTICSEVSIADEHDFRVQEGLPIGEIAQKIDCRQVVKSEDVGRICKIKCLQYNVCSLGVVGARKFLAEGFCA